MNIIIKIFTKPYKGII